MKIQNVAALFFVSVALLAACVSPQQYEILLNENEFLEEENNVLREELSFNPDEHLLEGKLESDVARLENELLKVEKKYTDLEKTYLDLSSKYNLMVREKGGTVTGGSSNYGSELTSMRQSYDNQNKEMRIMEMTLQQKEMKIKDLERLLYGQNFSN